MTKEEGIAFLGGYRRAKNEERLIKDKIEKLQQQIEDLRISQMTVSAVTTEGMPKGSTVRDALADYVAILDGLERELQDKVQELKDLVPRMAEELQKVETAINGVADPVEREILWLYYVVSMKFDCIADVVGYSGRQVRRIHMRAIDKMSCNVRP